MKNKSIIYLIFLTLLLACSNIENTENSSKTQFDSGFSLHQDTISVEIKGEMTHALKYQDKYYVLFEQTVLRYGGRGKRWLCIYSNGQVEKIVDCPKEMRTAYLDFYVKKDSLILKPYMDMQSYYLNLENYNWIEIDKTDDLIFEDDSFQVFSLDFGEWGGKTWFKEKSTGHEYVLDATVPLVNKIGSTYYLTNPFQVLEIKNPRLLNKCRDDMTYSNIESFNEIYSWQSKSTGFDTVYRDTTFDYFDFKYKSHIVSSFVKDKELLHIYETDTATFIARHIRTKIEPIQKIRDNMSFYNKDCSYRCRNLKGNNELLKFHRQAGQTFGLLEIIDGEIRIKYIINRAVLEPEIVGSERSDSIFIDRLKTMLPNFNQLTFRMIDSKEQSWGSFDITPNHKIGVGDSWNPKNYELDTCRSYLVEEDAIFSNSILYFGTKDSNLVRVITIDWDYERNCQNPDSEDDAIRTFDHKAEFLIDYISKNIGKPATTSDEKDYVKRTWETSSGITLYLSQNKKYFGIRLAIFEK